MADTLKRMRERVELGEHGIINVSKKYSQANRANYIVVLLVWKLWLAQNRVETVCTKLVVTLLTCF